MLDYNKIFAKENCCDPQHLYNFFWNEVADIWTSEYVQSYPKHGEIFQQTFEGYAFLVDFVWDYMEQEDVDNELTASRVIGFFGISNNRIKPGNRVRMRGEGKTAELYASLKGDYDKGHYIAHSMGAP